MPQGVGPLLVPEHDRRLDTASIFERLFAVYAAQFTLIVPAAVLVFLPVAVLSPFVQKHFKKGMLAGAVKG